VNGSSEWLSRSDRPGKFHPTFHNFRSCLVQKQTDTDSNDLIILSFFSEAIKSYILVIVYIYTQFHSRSGAVNDEGRCVFIGCKRYRRLLVSDVNTVVIGDCRRGLQSASRTCTCRRSALWTDCMANGPCRDTRARPIAADLTQLKLHSRHAA